MSDQKALLSQNALLHAHIRAWQQLLAHAPGRCFALYCSDSLVFASALFAAWSLGKTIYVPSDTLQSTCASLRGAVDGYLGEFDAEWSPLMIDKSLHNMGTDAVVWDVRRLPADHLGLVVYTSGSTGVAQGIPKRLGQLAAEVSTLEVLFGTGMGDAKILATVSHQHIYGLLFKVLWPLAVGRVIHGAQCMFPEELLAACQESACVVITSPAHLKRFSDSVFAEHVAALDVRQIFSSGGPLPFETVQQWTHLLGHAPTEVYGSSETGGIAWRQRTADGSADTGWTPLPGVHWRIDPEQGVLMIQSPHLAPCDVPQENWYATADRAVVGTEGTFILQGRTDRLVKIEEKRISLTGIEQALCALPWVDEARVLVRGNSPHQRQHIVACLVPSAAGWERLAAEGKLAFNRLLRAALVPHVERVALPRSWRYVEAMPRDAQGKITYAGLLQMLSQPLTPVCLPHARLLEQDAVRVVYELRAPRDLLYFSGHFADAPILAGVVQVDWVIHFGRANFVLPSRFLGVQALKFQRVIHPEMPFTMELIHEPLKSSLHFRLTSVAGQHGSGRILFGA